MWEQRGIKGEKGDRRGGELMKRDDRLGEMID
jgi:hypothetical protein